MSQHRVPMYIFLLCTYKILDRRSFNLSYNNVPNHTRFKNPNYSYLMSILRIKIIFPTWLYKLKSNLRS